MMEVDNTEFLFVFRAHYQQKEFVGQKTINEDVEGEVFGDSATEVLDNVWLKAKTLVKRKIMTEGDNFKWAEAETPNRDDIGNFVIFQDKAEKKSYLVSQITTDVLKKMRNKHVNVMVHVHGKAISSKAIHSKMCAVILQPVQRDRVGAHRVIVFTDLVQNLKQKHGTYLSANNFAWTMWANAIHSAPVHTQVDLQDALPPQHLVHLFHSIPTCEIEKQRSVHNGLQIASNLNDSYLESFKLLREEFISMKESTQRAFDLFERRLNATEEMLKINSRFVSSVATELRVEVNPVSIQEEQQVTDLPDLDHE